MCLRSCTRHVYETWRLVPNVDCTFNCASGNVDELLSYLPGAPHALPPVMAAPPPAGRVPVAITCSEGTDPFRTDQPLVIDGGTFASDLQGGLDRTGPVGGLEAFVLGGRLFRGHAHRTEGVGKWGGVGPRRRPPVGRGRRATWSLRTQAKRATTDATSARGVFAHWETAVGSGAVPWAGDGAPASRVAHPRRVGAAAGSGRGGGTDGR